MLNPKMSMNLICLFLIIVLAPGCGSIDPTSTGETPPLVTDGGKCDGINGSGLPFQSYFLPYDDTLSLELQLIDEVIKARQADGQRYEEGENPYTIHYAVYNLRHPDITASLARAESSGVDVQILIDSEQLDPARTWNVMDEYLIEHGFEYAPSHKDLSARQKVTADLIGIIGDSLMHLKTRLYRHIDPATGKVIEKLLTGSMNPDDQALFNNETLYFITDGDLIKRYREKYQGVLNGQKIQNKWDASKPINVLFSPDKGVQARDKILDWIATEEEAIFISVYAFRNFSGNTNKNELVKSLIAAHDRGVKVIVVTDHKHVDGVDVYGNYLYPDDPIEDTLRDAGIAVYECTNASTDFTAMHTKMAIFGLRKMKVVTDAGNWTRAALGTGTKYPYNDESYLFIDSARLDNNLTGLRHLGAFLSLIRKYDGQNREDGEKSFDELFASLIQIGQWPQIEIHISAKAETRWGETVFLTGDHPELGNWLADGPGVRLTTTETTYPLWHAEDTISLPCGTRIELKLIKKNDAGHIVQWMPGNNIEAIIDPHDLRYGDISTPLSATAMQILVEFD